MTTPSIRLGSKNVVFAVIPGDASMVIFTARYHKAEHFFGRIIYRVLLFSRLAPAEAVIGHSGVHCGKSYPLTFF